MVSALVAIVLGLILSVGSAHAQQVTCVAPSTDGASCLVPAPGIAGTTVATVTSPGTFLDATGRFQAQGNPVVTLQTLPVGQRMTLNFGACLYAYDSVGGFAAVPAAYSAPWDPNGTPVTSPTGHGTILPQLANVPCAVGARTVTVGGGAAQAAWKTVQVSTDGVTWVAASLTPLQGATPVGSWYTPGGTFQLPQAAGWVYVQFLVATKVATGWAYGGCSSPQLTTGAYAGCTPKWSIQGFFVPSVGIASLSVSPGSFSSPGQVNWPISISMTDSSAFSGSYYIAGPNACGFKVTANAVTLATMCPAGTYSDWQVMAVPSSELIPTMSIPGGSATATGGPTITSISAGSNCVSATACSVLDNVSVGTVITTFTCTMSDGSSCPPSGYGWSLTGQPSFVAIGQGNGQLTTATPPPLPDGVTNFSVNVNPIVATVVSISPTAIGISDQAPLGTQFQFTCGMSDGSQCSGRTWSFSGLPGFLTSGTNSGGGYVQTTQAPPLTDSSGSFTVTAQ